ncbi:MAG: hypothetical protein GY861_27275 [bacterium]|nr:hypothetical protein [bacterium]
MILAERSAKPNLNVSCIDWAFKRMGLAQCMIVTLLQGGINNYYAQFKGRIAPYIKQAFIQKKEYEEAAKMG